MSIAVNYEIIEATGDVYFGVIQMKVLYFDYCAFAICVIMLISVVFRKMVNGKASRVFTLLLAVSFLVIIFDIWAVRLDNMGEGRIGLKYFTHCAYLILRNFTLVLYDFYLVALTDTWHRLRKNKPLMLLMPLPFFAVFFGAVSSPFNNFVFYLDETDTYTRGSGFVILYVAAAIYVLFGAIHLFLHRGDFSRERTLSQASVFPLLIFSVALQAVYPRLLVEMFFNVMGLLFIMFMVQRPEERIDVVTGLSKISAYADDMKRAFKNEKPMQVIMVNIGNYHSLQEVLGYDDLRQILRKLGSEFIALNRQQRLSAEVYYLDDGMFRMVVDQEHFDRAAQVADIINQRMKESLLIREMEITMQTYVCMVRCPEDIDSFETLIALGNDLNKLEYKGAVLQAEDILRSSHYDLMQEIDVIIEKAVVNKKFEVYYQPIYAVREQRFNSAEALLRLKDEKYGFISPEIFIPAAERSGAIYQIGDYVFEEVCRFISSEEYRDLGIDYIEINVSVMQCMQPGLAEDILAIMKKYRVRPDQINLEITETAASYSQKIMEKNILDLAGAGISFSLDDFGTGYSNMCRIASLPLDIVKLDKTFTDMENSEKLQIILKNTIRMIKAMNMKIVVEGIETEQILQKFSELQCEYIQGYYFSRPLPLKEFVEFIREA